jgi:hypothetical protein
VSTMRCTAIPSCRDCASRAVCNCRRADTNGLFRTVHREVVGHGSGVCGVRDARPGRGWMTS